MGERKCVLARWGLVPSWAKDLKFGNRCINARAETIATTPAFREAYAKRHCLVPLNAFFEWSGEKGHKTKWRIRLKDEPLFALAGLWEWWRDPATQQGIETYTIITTEANAVLAPLHDRMPVIVGAADYARWLDAGADSATLLAPYPRRGADGRAGMSAARTVAALVAAFLVDAMAQSLAVPPPPPDCGSVVHHSLR